MDIPNTYPMTGPDPVRLPDGSLRPVDPVSGKPLMADTEASWHSHVSAVAAREEVESAGGDKQVMGSLLSAAVASEAGGPRIGDLVLMPLSVGTMAAAELLNSIHTRENPTGQPMRVTPMDMALTALIFARPEWCYELAEAGRHDEVKKAALKLSFLMTNKVMREVNNFIAREMAEFYGEDATAKKPDSASPPPEATPPNPPSSATDPDPSTAGSPP